MSKGLFITGTGTDIGKTYVTALLVKTLRQHGYDVGYYKAAISGAPTSVVNNNCRVKGQKGTGMRIKAPMAIKAVNKANRTKSRVVQRRADKADEDMKPLLFV